MSLPTLADAAAAAERTLSQVGVTSPRNDARWLVEAAAGTDPRRAPDAELTDEAAAELARLVERRAAREPLQLVLGRTVFRTIELRCRPGVFIPRPETEILAQIVIDLVHAASPEDRRIVVHEPCCGTGAVGLAIASEVERAVVLLGDRSADAAELAGENRDRLVAQGRLRAPVEVHRGNLLDAFAASVHGRPDVIVANPPYLPDADLPSLEPEVGRHDPADALAGGPDGHEIVDLLLAHAAASLVPGGSVVLEIDARRHEDAVASALRSGLVDVEVRSDLTGTGRFVLARSPGGARTRR